MAKKNTRDYPKPPRFFKGGSVPPDPAELERRAGERNTREGLAWSRERAIDKLGAGRPEDYERKPGEMVIKKPDQAIVLEVDPKDASEYFDKDI